MITTPTVLVLGAGASCPFGFPTGRQLLDVIVSQAFCPKERLADGYDPGTLGGLLCRCGYDPIKVSNFGQTLGLSQRNSVDEFLEHRPDEYLEIGKAAIAAALSPYETLNSLAKGDWYRYLFKELNSSFENFDKNKLSIITFNYDRSIEQFLYSALRHSYGQGIKESAAKLSAIPIVHLYGSLGKLTELEPDGRPYGLAVTGGIVQERAKQIKIIHENSDNQLKCDLQFKEAHRHLAAAERVCFLGFGYDATNLRRLLQPKDVLTNKWVVGSAKDLTDEEKARIKRLVPGDLQLRGPKEDCLATLRETGILF